jgi:hypothetical protein
VLDTTRCQLRAAGITPRLPTVVADSGYVSEAVFARAHTDKIPLLAPLSKDTRLMRDGGDPAAGQDLSRRPDTARGQRRLRRHRGRADYRQELKGGEDETHWQHFGLVVDQHPDRTRDARHAGRHRGGL